MCYHSSSTLGRAAGVKTRATEGKVRLKQCIFGILYIRVICFGPRSKGECHACYVVCDS